jgi:hypothetical protein
LKYVIVIHAIQRVDVQKIEIKRCLNM